MYDILSRRMYPKQQNIVNVGRTQMHEVSAWKYLNTFDTCTGEIHENMLNNPVCVRLWEIARLTSSPFRDTEKNTFQLYQST